MRAVVLCNNCHFQRWEVSGASSPRINTVPLLRANQTCRITQRLNAHRMVKMNITIQLDDNDISLTELLSAILHKEHVPVNDVPVVKVEEPTPQKQEEEAPTKKPRKKPKARKDRNYVCRECGATETSQWRQIGNPDGPKCNICHMREWRQKKAETTVKSMKKMPVTKVEDKPSKPIRQTKPIKAPRKRNEHRRPDLSDIGGLVNNDRIALLKGSNFNTVRRFAQAHPDKLMTVMGCSLNELEALENAQRKAAALHRRYSLISSAQRNAEENQTKKATQTKPEWSDNKLLLTVWNGIEGREIGAYMLQDVVGKAYEIANANYSGLPKEKKLYKQLEKTAQKLFARIIKEANSPSFSILGTGTNSALLVLSKEGWPTLRDIEA